MLFKVVGYGVADFANLFQFAFRFQLIQIAHGGTARNPELLSDFRITQIPFLTKHGQRLLFTGLLLRSRLKDDILNAKIIPWDKYLYS